MAPDYLCNPDVQISELALLLGYSEISAFSRAFHRWFDTSPSEWRRGYLKAQGISRE
ncbi:helix-turn-helix domain-containing protein [Burkholderia sp. TSV86]|uniref:helix-turn-helix domain-containing protein n=1 Tax=Burkholderia sp. TSV86 TaxID=1385594 RepID=UPI0018D24C7D